MRTMVGGSSVTVRESIGEPYIVKTIEHEPILVHKDQLSPKNIILENLQRTMLLVLENKRLHAYNGELYGKVITLES